VKYVLDASAMIALLRDEPGAQKVEDIATDRGNSIHAHAMNLVEVFYDFHRGAGVGAAKDAMDDQVRAGVVGEAGVSGAWLKKRLSCEGLDDEEAGTGRYGARRKPEPLHSLHCLSDNRLRPLTALERWRLKHDTRNTANGKA
jgi:hypothetical protein